MSKTHSLHCQEPWFTLIKSGVKPVEGRKDHPRFADWQPGDILIFTNGDSSFETTITYLHRYPSIEAYLEGEAIERALPGVASFDEARRIYLQWSTPEEVAERGFIGIGVRAC